MNTRREQELKREWESPDFTKGQRETLLGLDQDWHLAGQSIVTRTFKAKHARLWGRHLKKPYKKATRNDIKAYLSEMSNRCAPETVAGAKRFLKSFYKDLLAPDAQTHPPLVAWIKTGNPLQSHKLPKDLLSPGEIKSLADATNHPRDRALIMLLYESAGRV
ncbi:MAG: phage integrase N-terminal SAM-like domain-containing protein [Euryarchaeota archaeon]|nr:phage integrase N-terminal SAM-like domain-containing protein [Euryarchaeota archaeon]